MHSRVVALLTRPTFTLTSLSGHGGSTQTRKELVAGGFRDRHWNVGNLLLSLGASARQYPRVSLLSPQPTQSPHHPPIPYPISDTMPSHDARPRRALSDSVDSAVGASRRIALSLSRVRGDARLVVGDAGRCLRGWWVCERESSLSQTSDRDSLSLSPEYR